MFSHNRNPRRWLGRASQGRFAVATILAAPWVVRRLREEGLESTLDHISKLDPWRAGMLGLIAGSLEPERARVAVSWAFRVAPHLEGDCLEQALTQYVLQKGEQVRFVVGVKRDPANQFGAHAWVEHATPPPEATEFAPILVRAEP